jgi:hypothetical protein
VLLGGELGAGGRHREWQERDPLIAIVHQGPDSGALVTQPEALHAAWRLAVLSGNGGSCISRDSNRSRLDLEQPAFSQAEKGSCTLRIRTVTEHGALHWRFFGSSISPNLEARQIPKG